MNASIPVYHADGSLYACVSEQRVAPLLAAGLVARVVRHRKGHINRAILFLRVGEREPLLAWQRKVLRDIYGNVSLEMGRRKYRSAYISVGKKNGKSFLIGGLPIYHLLMEDERRGSRGAGFFWNHRGHVFSLRGDYHDINPSVSNTTQVYSEGERRSNGDDASAEMCRAQGGAGGPPIPTLSFV